MPASSDSNLPIRKVHDHEMHIALTGETEKYCFIKRLIRKHSDDIKLISSEGTLNIVEHVAENSQRVYFYILGSKLPDKEFDYYISMCNISMMFQSKLILVTYYDEPTSDFVFSNVTVYSPPQREIIAVSPVSELNDDSATKDVSIILNNVLSTYICNNFIRTGSLLNEYNDLIDSDPSVKRKVNKTTNIVYLWIKGMWRFIVCCGIV